MVKIRGIKNKNRKKHEKETKEREKALLLPFLKIHHL
jgi:hypothetical protein